MSIKSQFSAENVPLNDRFIYITPDGQKLCAKDADRYVQHMVRRKVNGFITSHDEICDECGSIINSRISSHTTA